MARLAVEKPDGAPFAFEIATRLSGVQVLRKEADEEGFRDAVELLSRAEALVVVAKKSDSADAPRGFLHSLRDRFGRG